MIHPKMPIYSLADVVELTGINAHTLRKWETRYNILTAERTKTNIRYYTEGQLKKLLNISLLLQNGYRISQIDKMTEDELYGNTMAILETPNENNSVHGLILAMLAFDELTFEDILRRFTLEKGLVGAITELIYPFLSQVGILWITHKAMPAQEHFVSNLIKKRLYAAIDQLPPAHAGAPLVVMFLPPDEYHEIGLLLAYYMARAMNWRVLYLGGNVPLSRIEEVLRLTKPQVIMSLFFTQKSLLHYQELTTLSKNNNIKLVVSGPKELGMDAPSGGNVIIMKQPSEFLDVLQEESKIEI